LPFGEADEGVDDAWVELGAGTAPELGERLVFGQRPPVGPEADHRVEGVAAEDDPCAGRDLLACQAVRVAVAVPALVAGADEEGDVAERSRAAENLCTDERVAGDELPVG
jgi:hypothetical protein